jgi:hypothetical protein
VSIPSYIFAAAGVIFFGAAVISNHKGHLDASFRNMAWGLGSMIIAVVIS